MCHRSLKSSAFPDSTGLVLPWYIPQIFAAFNMNKMLSKLTRTTRNIVEESWEKLKSKSLTQPTFTLLFARCAWITPHVVTWLPAEYQLLIQQIIILKTFNSSYFKFGFWIPIIILVQFRFIIYLTWTHMKKIHINDSTNSEIHWSAE